LFIASGSRTDALVSDYSFKDKPSTGQKAHRLVPTIELQLASFFAASISKAHANLHTLNEGYDHVSLGSPQFRYFADPGTLSLEACARRRERSGRK
jgi:hypothetical protein